MENTMTMSKSYEQKMLERRRELFEQAPGEEAVEKRSESVKHFRLGAGPLSGGRFPRSLSIIRKTATGGRTSTTTSRMRRTILAVPCCATGPTACAWN